MNSLFDSMYKNKKIFLILNSKTNDNNLYLEYIDKSELMNKYDNEIYLSGDKMNLNHRSFAFNLMKQIISVYFKGELDINIVEDSNFTIYIKIPYENLIIKK